MGSKLWLPGGDDVGDAFIDLGEPHVELGTPWPDLHKIDNTVIVPRELLGVPNNPGIVGATLARFSDALRWLSGDRGNDTTGNDDAVI